MISGSQIGRYELVRLVGRGGSGEVWEAVLVGPAGFRKPVALKLFRGEQPYRFVGEACLGAQMSHPNIAATYELGEADGVWYIAMELVRGPTLSALARRQPLPADAVVEIGVQVSAALDHLHRMSLDRPLVHGDIKPSNLLVDPSGLVKLVDFGLSRSAGMDGRDAGTPGFVPCEQLQGRIEPRSDLFALGVSLCWLASHRWPFGRGVASLYRTWRGQCDLDALSERLDAQVCGLGPIVARCLRKDVSERWRDAAELGSALRELRRTHSAEEPLRMLYASRDLGALADRPELAPECLVTERLLTERLATICA